MTNSNNASALNNQDLLVEIGTEELPPKALNKLSNAFRQEIEKGLKLNNLGFSSSVIFATPRRLAVLVSALQTEQDPVSIEKYGPALKAAFDDQGNPSKAAEGFARSCGVSVEELQQKSDGKVEKLYFSTEREGEQTSILLPEIINNALAALPIPKRMRWGASREEFVRPVHWAVVLLGEELVSTKILGIQSGNQTQGHRFHHPHTIILKNPAEYEQTLLDSAFVIPDFNKRKEQIRFLIQQQAQQLEATVDIDEDLLDEVTALVEWPVALTGNFDESYLAVPREALISSLKKHQKCFYLSDSSGNIKPNFITVSNIESLDPAKVIAGNEKVIGPRLADASFFYEQDKKSSLESRREKLQTVIFEKSLGTVFDKSERVARLSAFIAEQIGSDTTLAIRAAQLAKCDLLTGMVGEFADLQGTMGQYYASHDGEADEVAKAMNEQYLPRFSGDSLPESATGIVLALAERIDTIVGLFAIGQPPTGSKDPFALRRAALGILRIIVEKKLDLDLEACINSSIKHFSDLPDQTNLQQDVLDFIFDRFKAWYADEGVASNIFLAVDAVRTSRPLDFDQRIKAVNQFASLDEAEALSMANKRVSNILSKLTEQPSADIDTSLLNEEAEIQLSQKLTSLLEEVKPLLANKDYSKALTVMATLQKDVDLFFEEVMVNTEDESIRNNRQSLLQQLRQLFLQIADISLLQSS